MVRWRGVSYVEFSVLDYDDSIAFYDALFAGSDTVACRL